MTTMTTDQFQELAERRFREINPGIETTIRWEFFSKGYVPHRIGEGSSRTGHFIAMADGHHSRRVMAEHVAGAADVSLR